MDAVKFIKERDRMCKSFDNCSCGLRICPAWGGSCKLEPGTDLECEADKQVEIVKDWAAAHPRKMMVSDEALKKLQEQIAAWPMERRFVVQQLIRDYLRNREDLRAYEATGLTAEDITAAVSIPMFVKVASQALGATPERLRELAEADKDGRVAVLPVKPVLTPTISSMLYIIEDGEIYEDSLYEGIVGMSERGEMNVIYGTIDELSFEQNDIGKTVFLTREEAEKALEAMGNE